ncbi:MAG: right-handed parallel beta-helix repeat-containing protein [Promethearchaeota archaeon]
MNSHLKNNNRKNKKKCYPFGILHNLKKSRIRLLVLFAIFLFSIIFIIDSPINFNSKPEDSQTPTEKNLELSNEGDNIFKFKLAISNNPVTIDPHNVWDVNSGCVIDQVCEGLYMYNISDPNYPIIPNLAIANGSWSVDNLNYTVPLRTGVTFHDGFGFKAIDVKQSFNRLQYFINASGNLPSNTSIAVMESLYKFLDGTPIINRTEVISDYSVRFVLNRPYGPFQALLCYYSSYIISTNSTPKYSYISPSTGDLVGTGPFVYDGGTAGEEIRFHAFDNYWNGKPDIELLYFKIMGYDRNDAILNGSIDYITSFDISMLSDFNANPDVKVVDNDNDLAIYYLCMNNQKINKTFRQVISYSINYSYITDNAQQGFAERAKSPVPPGISYSNWSNNYAIYNVTKAREIMQSMGFGIGWDTTFPGTSEANWASANFVSYNFSYWTGSSFHTDLYTLLNDNLEKVGVDVIDGGTSYEWYLTIFYGTNPGGYNDIDLMYTGWGPDFNDPSNMINPLFSNNSAANRGLTNDPYLQTLMEQGLNETEPSLRKVIYNEIQKYLVEDLMPVAFLYVQRNFDVYRNYILGYQSNKWEKIWLHGVTQNSSLAPQKININGNQEWTYFKNAGKCTGSGTYSDPYVIADLLIDANGFSNGILIKNTTVFFRIENCTVYNSGNGTDDAGIKLQLVSNGRLINNNASYNHRFGILLYYNYNTTVSGNSANNNDDTGIYLQNSNNNTVSGNSANNNILNGIYLIFSNNTKVVGNLLNGNGVYSYFDSDGSNNVFTWNVINGFAYPFNIDDTGGGDFTWAQAIDQLAWVTGSGTYSDPYIIKDLIIGGANSSSCIFIENSNVHSKIENCRVFDSSATWPYAGIQLFNVSNCQIVDNNCSNNNGRGITLANCNNNTVNGNTLYLNGDHGIGLYSSNNTVISGNTAYYNNYDGISIYLSTMNTLSGNNAYDNNYDGIRIWKSNNSSISTNTIYSNTQNGISLWKSNSSTISGNTIYDNTYRGIRLEHSNNIDVTGNNVYSNDEDGILSYWCDNIEISGNTANNNNWHGIILDNTDGNVVMRNTFNNNNERGIWIENCANTEVIGNILNGNSGGTYYESGSNNEFLANLANGYINPIVFDDSGGGDFTWTEATSQIAWFSGSGTGADPYIIENIIINAQGSGSCIEIIGSNDYLIIRNSKFTNSGSGTLPHDAGIRMESVTGITELNNVNCSNNGADGIYLLSCSSITIKDSTINNNDLNGIALYNSGYNYIEDNDNTINYNEASGIYLSAAHNNEIDGNTINYNGYGIFVDGSMYNNIDNNDLRYNIGGGYKEIGDSSGNIFGPGNILDPVSDNMFWIIIIIIACIIALVAITIVVVLKKRSAVPKKVKEKKPEISLEERTAMTILKEEKRKEKQKLKMEEKGRKVEAELLKRMSTVDFLIKEDKFEIALKSLVRIKEEAQTHRIADITTKAEERIDLCKKLGEERKEQERIIEEERLREEKQKEEEKLEKERLKEEERRKKEKLKEEERLKEERQRTLEKEAKIKEEFEKRIANVEYFIKENKTEMAIKVLLKIQEEAQAQGFEDIVNSAEEKLIEYKKLQLETVNRIKQTILTLGAKFTRLQLLDISEKSGIQDEALIENIIHEMIRNKEISGEYFESSKALALEAAAPVKIEESVGKHNVFISYSTLDTDYFQVSKIVRRLELYPEINQVLFWEVDSKQNIVEFMEETLRKTNAFILFCSEHSIKSQAVKGEWMSAYQMLKKGLMKIIPVYEDEDHIPRLLWQMLNVKYTKDDFEGFIQKLYEEIIR